VGVSVLRAGEHPCFTSLNVIALGFGLYSDYTS
jgi:hypothetical protein